MREKERTFVLPSVISSVLVPYLASRFLSPILPLNQPPFPWFFQSCFAPSIFRPLLPSFISFFHSFFPQSFHHSFSSSNLPSFTSCFLYSILPSSLIFLLPCFIPSFRLPSFHPSFSPFLQPISIHLHPGSGSTVVVCRWTRWGIRHFAWSSISASFRRLANPEWKWTNRRMRRAPITSKS